MILSNPGVSRVRFESLVAEQKKLYSLCFFRSPKDFRKLLQKAAHVPLGERPGKVPLQSRQAAPEDKINIVLFF